MQLLEKQTVVFNNTLLLSDIIQNCGALLLVFLFSFEEYAALFAKSMVSHLMNIKLEGTI